MVRIIKENAVDALSIQLTREDCEIRIVEGAKLTTLDNRGLELGAFDSISSTATALDRVLGWDRDS